MQDFWLQQSWSEVKTKYSENVRKIKSFPWGEGGDREREEKRERQMERQNRQTDHEHTNVKCIPGTGHFLNKRKVVRILWLLSKIFTETL